VSGPAVSKVRVVKIYANAPMPLLGGVTPVTAFSWPIRHPLDSDFFWIDLTNWCGDASTTLLQIDAVVALGDGELSILACGISGQFGFVMPEGGTPGFVYTIQMRAIASTGVSDTWNIALPTVNAAPYAQIGPYLTVNASPMTIGDWILPDGTAPIVPQSLAFTQASNSSLLGAIL
jgi:hypothetical protein